MNLNEAPQYKILVVDDEVSLGALAKAMFTVLNQPVTVVSKPLEADELWRSNPTGFDILYTDNQMPLLNGVELSRRVKEYSPRVAVIMATGLLPEEVIPTLPENSVDILLRKPVGLAILRQALEISDQLIQLRRNNEATSAQHPVVLK